MTPTTGGHPQGVVTLLFTDIEGSTKLLHVLSADVAVQSLALHGQLLREVFRQYGGYEQRTEGDSFFVVFQDASAAVAAAAAAQRSLDSQDWPGDLPVKVRMGLHTGEPMPVEGDYVGLDVHRAARIASAGHGGQVLISQETRAAASLPDDVTLRDLGEHRLKDLVQPEWIHQLEIGGLNNEFPPLNSLETPSNLPVPTARLVGRQADVAAVERLLRSDGVRLVTITGTGGSGKTSLALTVAGRLADAFRGGLVFVDLTSVSDATRVVDSIAMALELPSEPGLSSMDSVMRHLQDRAVLLVLDNFEHVLGAAADVSKLLATARRVKVLATSRAALRTGVEREYPLQLLSEAASLELFVDLARAARPSFDSTTAGVEEDVKDICARLDYLPLAIELAAPRVRLFSTEQIRTNLEDRLGLLRGGRRDAPARQQTLRDTIAWSYDLLPTAAAAVLRSASVFVGGIALDALEQVSVEEGCLELTEVLLDQNLLRHEPATGRLVMLESIREFALERCRSLGELSETRRRHAGYFARLAAQAEVGLHGPEQSSWRQRLDSEQPNLLAALDWTLGADPPEVESAVMLAIVLSVHWYEHGRAVEGAAWLRRVHALEGIPDNLRAQLGQRLGVMLDQLADREASVVLEEAIELFEKVGDRTGQARALNSLGSVSRTLGSTGRARQLFEEALRIRQELDDREGISVSTFNLATLAMDDGDYQTAQRLFEESHAIDSSLGDEWGTAVGSLGIAAAAVAKGELETAEPRLRAAVRYFVDSDDDDHLAQAIDICAFAAWAGGHPERSARLLGAASAQRERIGLPLSAVDAQDVERCRSMVLEALGEQVFDRAHREGRAMTADQAVAYALETVELPGGSAGA